ncbi:reverse transcriptase [Tanacetum coccineum]
MTQTLVLALPDYNKTFVIETNTSRVGVVLQQEGHLIAYLSKTLAPKHQSLSIYEKELLTVLMALEKWRSYLLDRHFKIKTDHFSLKYLLNQRLTTPFQVKWLPKLMGFDYEISYNKGSENVVTNALSRLKSNVLKRKGKIVVGADEQLRKKIMQHYHVDAIGGHSSTNVKAHKVRSLFYWKGLHKAIMKVQWFPLVSIGINHKHSSINVTPFEVLYGQTPPLHNPYVAGESVMDNMDRSLQAREATIEMIKFHINRAHNRMKKYADLKRSKREFDVGMWVYLKLQLHKQVTIKKAVQNKFSAKYYGPFLIIAKVRTVAYKLELPSNSKIHPMFHVSQLKLCRGYNLKMGILPHCGVDGLLAIEPEVILDRRIGKQNNKAATYVLVKWVNHLEEDATWELYKDLIS